MSDQNNVQLQNPDPAAHAHHADRHLSDRARLRSVVWGIALVALGTIFLLDKLDLFESIDLLQDWWPLLLIAFGLYRGAHFLTGVGVWLLIGELELFGLSYSTSWPVILIVIGAAAVIRALTSHDEDHRRCCGLAGDRR